MSYLDLTIREIHAALVAKKTTPLELTKEAIERAKSNNDNAFELILEKEALLEAEKLGEVEEDNLLWGIPFVMKDNFSTKGIETTASSNSLSGYIPLFDAEVYTRLKEKKAILIGKTTLDELAMGGTGMTGHKGITYNPYDKTHTRMVGGSSCGSAAAVSASIVPFALGSDTGDSVRKPASFVGLVGVKPSWGRISRYGLFPFAPSLDHVGYFTRSVEDSAIILDVLAGRDLKDSTSSTKPVEKYYESLIKEKKPYKIAYIKELNDAISDKFVLNKFMESIEKLRKQNVTVEEISFDKKLLSAIYPTYFVISCAEATSNDANLDGIKFGPQYGGKSYQEVMFNARTRGFSELIKRRFVMGSFALMRENQNDLFLRAQKLRRMICDRLNEVFKEYDALYVLASPSVAPKFTDESDKLSSTYLIADNHLALANFSGTPSITIPLGMKEGLPFGANIITAPFTEVKMFEIAKMIQDITGLYNLSIVTEGK